MSDPTSIASIQRPNCGTELNICAVRISNVNECFFLKDPVVFTYCQIVSKTLSVAKPLVVNIIFNLGYLLFHREAFHCVRENTHTDDKDANIESKR